jgi:hypothetical protein
LHDKIRQRVTQCRGGDEFGWSDSWTDGPQPGAEGRPDQAWMTDGQRVRQSLGDETDLNVAMVDGELAADGGAVSVTGAVQVLSAGATGALVASGIGSQLIAYLLRPR